MSFRAKKKACLPAPIKGMILLLAAVGGFAIACEIKKRGKAAKRALGRAGCRCKDAAMDAAAEIFGESDG